MSQTEEQLLTQAKQGDAKSLETLLETFKPTVNSIARGCFLVGGDIDDLVQEGMIGLYKAILSYNKNDNTKFSTYAYVCIKRQVLEAIRASKRFKNLPLNNSYISINNQGMLVLKAEQDDDDEDGVFLTSVTPSPLETYLVHEQELKLTEKIKALLSEFEFNVLALYLKGFSYADIALKVKKDSKSVDNAISRIKTKLQSICKEGRICI